MCSGVEPYSAVSHGYALRSVAMRPMCDYAADRTLPSFCAKLEDILW